MRFSGIIASGALDEVAKIVKPGTRTDKIDKLCFEYFNDHGAWLFIGPFDSFQTTIGTLEWHISWKGAEV